MSRFILIHGAWHGGWVWDGVVEALGRAGHEAEAPTMPGHNPDDDRSRITFQDYADTVAEVVGQQSEPVVLVGHSSAGFMIQAGAPRAADKLQRMIFHNAFILPDGLSQFDIVPEEVAGGMIAAAEESEDNCVPVDEDFVRSVLMAGEDPAAQDDLVSRLTPQPVALFTTKVDTKPFQALTTPRSVVFCRDDISLPPGAYLGMAENLGDFDLLELDGGHETLFTRPEDVARALIKAAELG